MTPPLQVLQTGPLRRHLSPKPSSTRPVIFHFPSKSPVREPHPCSPNRVPMDRDTLSPEPMDYSFIYVCQSPKRNPPMKRGKTLSLSTEPHADGRPTYNGVRPGSRRGSFKTLLSLPQCHAAFGTIPSTLAWVDQSLVSQRVVATLNRVYPPKLLPPPT